MQLALPFSVLVGPGLVRLVCGEDQRYTLRGEGLEEWLPPLIAAFEPPGARAEELVGRAPAAAREDARQVLERLLAERVLVDAAPRLEEPTPFALELRGQGPVLEALGSQAAQGRPLAVLVQGSLDYGAAKAFSAECLAQGREALWVTTGPMNRAWVSPLLLPRDGPCVGCLLLRFERLSPFPELYGELERQAQALRPSPFPAEGAALLAQLVRWKARLASAEPWPAALFRLHQLDVGALEVSSHRVLREPDCEVCAPWR
ncbi:MAG: TOMM precursor leader peptide-binding protein [Planctomycetota bacterium]